MSQEEKIAAFEKVMDGQEKIKSLLLSPDESTDSETASVVAKMLIVAIEECEEDSEEEAISDFLEGVAQVARDLRG
jgi:hypothetical protein